MWLIVGIVRCAPMSVTCILFIYFLKIAFNGVGGGKELFLAVLWHFALLFISR